MKTSTLTRFIGRSSLAIALLKGSGCAATKLEPKQSINQPRIIPSEITIKQASSDQKSNFVQLLIESGNDKLHHSLTVQPIESGEKLKFQGIKIEAFCDKPIDPPQLAIFNDYKEPFPLPVSVKEQTAVFLDGSRVGERMAFHVPVDQVFNTINSLSISFTSINNNCRIAMTIY